MVTDALRHEAAEPAGAQRWRAHPVRSIAIRTFAFLLPIAASIAFVHFASAVIPVPTSSFFWFAGWWILMSGSATLVLLAFDRVTRRLLPLAALYKVSLLFPDHAPSRFRTAMRTNTVGSLEERIALARAGGQEATPVEAAEQLLGFVAELNVHDRLTRGHSERVRAYAQMIGQELRLGKQQVDLLNWAALLHDVGKLRVPSEILTSTGRPTDEEWEILRDHPLFGEELVAPLRSWLGEWADAVGDHHEHWDGAGYPRGKAGSEIALAGRIVAVADVYDVITSARSYKPAFSAAEGRDEIARCAGTQFDPRIVRAFLSIGLGRLRLAMGPLSWLAHAPMLGRLPLTPAIGSAGAAMLTVVAATTGGLLAGTPGAGEAATSDYSARHRIGIVAPSVERVVEEDEAIVVRLPGVTSSSAVRSLRIVRQPAVGKVVVLPGNTIRYLAAPNFSGTVTIGYEACAGVANCARGSITIVVRAVNDVPAATDDTARTSSGVPVTIDVLANDTDPEDDELVVRSVSVPSVGTVHASARSVRFTPPDRFEGTARFSYVASDGHGDTARAIVRVLVTPRKKGAAEHAAHASSPPPATASPSIAPPPGTSPAAPDPGNHAPTPGDDTVSLPEGSTVLLSVLANDADSDGDGLTLLSVGAAAHGVASRSGSRIQYIAPNDYDGRVDLAYEVVDAHGARATGNVAITVLPVNSAPSFVAGANETVAEDSGAHTTPGWATAISAGPSNEAGQSVSFLTTNDQPALFTPSGQPAVAANGTLTYTAAANATGTATVSVHAKDDGGTANGGADRSPTQTITITVLPVNSAPSFVAGANETVAEDSGAHTTPGWATAISAGPSNEAGQSVSFLTTNDQPALFTPSGQPAVSANGTLTYTAAANATGTATVSVHAKDDGGTANGGADRSPTQTITITILPVNSAPSFVAGANETVAEDSGAHTTPGWATAISAGPSNEAGQSVSFLTTNDQPALFTPSGQPAVAANGTLTYTAAANATGTATVSVHAKDDGGTANGGADRSPTQTITITIQPVNDPPVATDDTVSLNEDLPGGVTFDVFANDTDPDGDALSVLSFDDSSLANGTLSDNGGGNFTYAPDADTNGVEAFTYTVGDGAGGTASGTVTITVAAQPDPPIAGSDSFLTPQDTVLNAPAPGVLANDGDPDGDPITLQTTAVTGPANGSVTLNADGSFDYTPNPGFGGSDGFTYHIDDGTGHAADGTVTITVDTVAVPSTLYLQPSGASADVFDLATTLPPAAATFADLDGDGDPGLTIKKSDGKETISDPAKQQTWAYALPASLTLNGPVSLQFWSTLDSFLGLHEGTLYTYLYDCAGGGTSCVRIASNKLTQKPWNTSLLCCSWSYRSVSIGTVNRTIAAGRELRVRVLFDHRDLWMTMTAAYPSALQVTVG